jgi:hypothetical protein
MKNKIINGKLLCIAVIVVILACSNVFAICLQDNLGNVLCPKYANGGIFKNSAGDVVCGKGDCRVDPEGNVQCSKVPSGSAGIDSSGSVVCVQGCEPASKDMCVQEQK